MNVATAPIESAVDDVGDLLTVDHLSVAFFTENGEVPAVRGVSFSVPRGKTLALLGESGCGKSVTARSILNLIDPPGRVTGGRVVLRDSKHHPSGAGEQNLLELPRNGPAIRAVRWARIAMVFQDPRNALTPAFTVGKQIAEAIRHHQGASPAEARRRAIELLEAVGIPGAARRVDDYPHQLSGGMCQRVVIAMALACDPDLLIADEPTTALDVTIQAQVLRLMRRLQRERGTSILLITHDMGVVAEMADEVAVMYLGQIVERGSVDRVFDHPAHPYTQGLLASTPGPSMPRDVPLPTIPGSVPTPGNAPEGCAFRGRCGDETPRCRQTPPSFTIAPGHAAACWLHDVTHQPQADATAPSPSNRGAAR